MKYSSFALICLFLISCVGKEEKQIPTSKEFIQVLESGEVTRTEKGILAIDHIDHILTGEYEQKFYLEQGTERIPFTPTNENLHELEAQAGQVVTLSFTESKGEKARVSVFTQAVNPKINERVLILLVRFPDSLPIYPQSDDRSIDARFLKDSFNKGIYQKYMQDNFQGLVNTKIAHVEDWYEMPKPCTEYLYGGKSIAYLQASDINKIITERNIDMSLYDNISLINYCGNQVAWGIASALTIQNKRVTTTQNIAGQMFFFLNTLTEFNAGPHYSLGWFYSLFLHEKSHNYNMAHANAIDCDKGDTKKSAPYPCKVITYGNPFSLMGSHSVTLNHSAHELLLRGFRKEEQFLRIHEPGTYTIDKLLSKKRDSKIGAYIYSPYSTYPVMFLEHRVPESFDQKLKDKEFASVRNGLIPYSSLLGTEGARPYWAEAMRQVDPYVDFKAMDLGNASDYADRASREAIHSGRPYVDYRTGLTIKVKEQSLKSESVVFEVSYNDSERQCFKAPLTKIVGAFEFQIARGPLNPIGARQGASPGVEKYYPVVKKGETYIPTFLTKNASEAFCPQGTYEAELVEYNDIKNWLVKNSNEIKSNFYDTDSKLGFQSAKFKVPDDADTKKIYRLKVEFRDSYNGKQSERLIEFKVAE